MSNLTEQWENGALGRDEKFVQKSSRTRQDLDEKLALQAISIRLQKELIQDFTLCYRHQCRRHAEQSIFLQSKPLKNRPHFSFLPIF